MENKVFEKRVEKEIAGWLVMTFLLSTWALAGCGLFANWFLETNDFDAEMAIFGAIFMFGWFAVFMLVVSVSDVLGDYLNGVGHKSKKAHEKLKKIVGD